MEMAPSGDSSDKRARKGTLVFACLLALLVVSSCKPVLQQPFAVIKSCCFGVSNMGSDLWADEYQLSVRPPGLQHQVGTVEKPSLVS